MLATDMSHNTTIAMRQVYQTGDWVQIRSRITSDNLARIFNRMCRCNRLDMVRQMLYEYNIDADARLDAFGSCIEHGHLSIAQWLWKVTPEIEIDKYIFMDSCNAGYLDLAQWMLQIASNLNIHADNEYIFRDTCANNRLVVAQWLAAISPGMDVHTHADYAIITSCKTGSIHVVKWLYAISPNCLIYYWAGDIFRMCCERGHLLIMQWLLSVCRSETRYQITDIDIHVDEDGRRNEYPFVTSCAHGYLDIAQWLLQISPDIIKNSRAFIDSCMNNQLHVAQWLMSVCFYSHRSLTCSILRDSVESQHDMIHICPYDIANVFEWCCNKGYLQVVQWLYCTFDIYMDEYGRPRDDGTYVPGCVGSVISRDNLTKCIFATCCQAGHLHVARFLSTITNSNHIKYYVTDDFGYIFTVDDDKLWSHMYALDDYGHLHYHKSDHLDEILQHYRMVYMQSRRKSANNY